MFSLRLLPLPYSTGGDIIIFRRLAQRVTQFEDAVLDVSTTDSDVFHVAMIVDEERIVHALPNKGVCLQSLESAVEEINPDVIELGRLDVGADQKRGALSFALQQAKGGAEYNDLFSNDCINSRNRHSFYCCQLVIYAYRSASLTNQSPFLDHSLNFKDKSGHISAFWKDYYRTRGFSSVPQGEPGSHPSKIRASPVVNLAAIRYCASSKTETLNISDNFLRTLHYVGGAFSNLGYSSSNSFKIYEPRSGSVLTEVSSPTTEEVGKVVSLSRTAQEKWISETWAHRSAILRNVGRLIRHNIDVLSEWEVRDNGKPITEAVADALSCADIFEYFSGIDLTERPGTTDIYTIPLGVIGAVGTWEYPMQSCSWNVASAITCGNAIIYKPSHLTPITSVLLAQIMTMGGIPDNLVNVLQGDTTTEGVVSTFPGVIRPPPFPGFVRKGKLTAQNSSKDNVKPSDLGDESKCLVLDDDDPETASNRVLTNFLGQGANRVLVHKAVIRQFTDILVEKIKNMRVGDPLHKSTHVGALISAEHVREVLKFIRDAAKGGANILCGGKQVTVQGLENGFYVSPCVLSNIDKDSSAYTGRIFGPVLLILPFEEDTETLQNAKIIGRIEGIEGIGRTTTLSSTSVGA